MYNILIGGEAGQGIDTMSGILAKLLKKSGYSVFVTKDLMSRIRGGHNMVLIRFGAKQVQSHSNKLDGIIALKEETAQMYESHLSENGFILCDTSFSIKSPKAIKLNMKDISKEIGNPRVSGSIAIGSILKLFGETLSNVEEILKKDLKEQHVDMNMKAVEKGFELVDKRFKHLKCDFTNNMIISGSEAIGLGAIAAELRFYTAYPMSPSTAIMVYIASKSVEADIVVEQAEDEIGAINMAIGASYAGARAMTSTSGGGFALMVEALGLAGITETPLVVVDVQRPGPATGLPTRTEQSDLKFVISASQGEFPRVVIALRNHTDSFYQTIRAFNIAEKYQIPVIILSDQYLADSYATVEPFVIEDKKALAKQKKTEGKYMRYQLTDDGISNRLIPGKTNHTVEVDSDEHDEFGHITESAEVRIQMVDKRMKKLINLKQELIEPEFIGSDKFEVLLLGWGSTYGPIKEAIEILNEKNPGKFAALVFGDVYPLPQVMLKQKSGIAKRIVNIEQNATGQLAGLIREETGIVCDDSILKYDGRQISSEEIVQRIQKEEK